MVQVIRQFDRDAMLQRLGGDDALLAEVLALFVSECPEMLAQTERAISTRDAPALQRAAHTLKGALLNIAADPAADHARRLEVLGSRESMDDTPSVLEQLRRSLDSLQGELDDLLDHPPT